MRIVSIFKCLLHPLISYSRILNILKFFEQIKHPIKKILPQPWGCVHILNITKVVLLTKVLKKFYSLTSLILISS